jgi:short-subunit dehydrogenase
MIKADGAPGTALVTGASSGIGREIAVLLARDGYNLVVVARRRERLEEIAEEFRSRYGVNVTVIPKDLSEPAAAAAIFAETCERGATIDILVNNAGFAVYGPYSSTVLTDEAAMLQVNIASLTILTKLFMRGMIERGRGRILNIASTAAFSPLPLASVYGATKAYVLSFSEAIAEELQGTGVTVTALCPGPTATEFAERAQMTDTRLFHRSVMSAAEAAALGYRAMMRGRRVTVTGLANQALVLSVRLSPRQMVAKVAKSMMGR